MKKKLLAFSFVLLAVFSTVSDVSGIGISPGRHPFNITENGGLNTEVWYFLYPPQGRYSAFQTLNPAGLNATITEFSTTAPWISDRVLTTAGIECNQDGYMLIDWDSAEKASWDGKEGIWAYVNISTPDNWANPAVAGGESYLTDMVRHIEIADPSGGIQAIAAAVSQMSLYRNYAPKTYLQSLATSGLAANLGLQFEDKQSSWWSRYIDSDYNGNPWLSYDIDWDGDGISDQSGAAIFDESPVFENNLYRWTSGIQASTFELDHVYEAAGSYTATITLRDSVETTTLEIPIEVVPEPATIALVALGGLFIRKYKFKGGTK